MHHLTRIVATIGLVAAIASIAACGAASGAPAPSDPPVDETRATRIATGILEAYNAGDYDAFTRDWSMTMKSAIGESDFRAFREQTFSARGRSVGLGTPSLSSSKPGVYRWTFPVTFEKGPGKLLLGFFEGSALVEGAKFE